MSNSPLPDLVPARMVNEFVYCPRLAYLEWVQGDWADNADTAEGRFTHRAVDRPSGALPPPDQPEEAQIEKLHARSVWLSAEEEGLTTRIDLIEAEGDAVTPVDYKRGSAPDLPEGAWEPDRVQLCAQALVLRANGYTCHSGVIYYAASKTRVTVVFDEALIARTRQAVRDLRAMAAAGRIPPPLVDSPKCVRCSLAPICLPDEVNYLTAAGQAEPGREIRRLVPARDDAAPLYVQEPGALVRKSGECFEVWLKDQRLGQARIFETSHIALFGAQITTPALIEALDRGINVAFFSMGGWFKGLAHGPAHKNVALRIAQYRAAFDPQFTLTLARAFVAAKIRNCRTMLMRNCPEQPKEAIDALMQLSKEARRAASMPELLGIEGNAGRIYFAAFAGMLKPRPSAETGEPAEWPFEFDGRSRRPPRDPVNALLSFAYSLLVKELTVLAQVVGFDPYMGFYHQPRYGRPSLALDVMEEFRPLIADSVVITAINTGALSGRDFVRVGPSIGLTPAGRKKFIAVFEHRISDLITHPIFGYRISYRRVLEVQLRLLGRVLDGELADYPAFTTR